MVHAGKDVEYLAFVCVGVADAIGCEKGQVVRGCECDGVLIALFFLAKEMALQLNEDVVYAEDMHEAFEAALCGGNASVAESSGERALLISCEQHESFGVLSELIERCGAESFFDFARFVLCDEAAKVAVSGLRLDEHGIAHDAPVFFDRDLSAIVGADAGALGVGVQAWGAIDSVAIEDGDAGQVLLGTSDDHALRE